MPKMPFHFWVVPPARSCSTWLWLHLNGHPRIHCYYEPRFDVAYGAFPQLSHETVDDFCSGRKPERGSSIWKHIEDCFFSRRYWSEAYSKGDLCGAKIPALGFSIPFVRDLARGFPDVKFLGIVKTEPEEYIKGVVSILWKDVRVCHIASRVFEMMRRARVYLEFLASNYDPLFSGRSMFIPFHEFKADNEGSLLRFFNFLGVGDERSWRGEMPEELKLEILKHPDLGFRALHGDTVPFHHRRLLRQSQIRYRLDSKIVDVISRTLIETEEFQEEKERWARIPIDRIFKS